MNALLWPEQAQETISHKYPRLIIQELESDVSSARKGAWAQFLASFGYAFHGLWHTLRTQRNARIHALVGLTVIMTGLFLHISAIEFAILFLAVGGVFITEMLNTVAELCIDLITPYYHPLAKIAKDVAAGAVLVSVIFSIMIGLTIFLPHLSKLL